jgi:hypothetical protein
MQPSTALHALIHALTQAEKRYLRVYASRHVVGEENQYMLLFDAIHRQDEYDEAAIKEDWTQAGIPVKNFPSVKNYLFNLILRAMREFNRDAHPVRSLEDQLEDVEFLYQRGLHADSLKLLARIKEKAQQYEAHALLLRIYAHERGRLIYGHPALPEANMASLNAETEDSLSHLRTVNALDASAAELMLLSRKHYRMRATDELAKLDLLRHRHQASGDPMGQQFLPSFHYHRGMAAMRELEGDYGQAFQHRATIRDQWQAHPHMRDAHPGAYVISLANLLAACHYLGRYDEMPALIADIRAAAPRHPAEAIEIRQNHGYYQLLYAMNAHQWQAVPAAITELEAVLKAHGPLINQARVLAIRYNIAIAHFFLEQHRPALHALNAILHDQQSQHRLDIQQATRLMQAVVHFQLGNLDLLDYLLRSVRRYLQTRGALYEFEEALIGCLKRLAGNPQERLPILTRLQGQLARLREDPQNAEAPGLQEVQHWVQAQLQGVPLREVLT